MTSGKVTGSSILQNFSSSCAVAGEREQKAGGEQLNEGEVPKVRLGTEHFSQTGRPFARCIRPYNLPMRFCKFLVTRGAIQNICIYVSCSALSRTYIYTSDTNLSVRGVYLWRAARSPLSKWTEDIIALRERRIHRSALVQFFFRHVYFVPPYTYDVFRVFIVPLFFLHALQKIIRTTYVTLPRVGYKTLPSFVVADCKYVS